MNRIHTILLIIIGLLCFGKVTWADAQLSLLKPETYKVTDFFIYHDTTQNLSVDQVIQEYRKGNFTEYKKHTGRVSYNETYWLRVEIFNAIPDNLMWMMEFNSQLSHVAVYFSNDKNSILNAPLQSVSVNNVFRNRLLVPLCYDATNIFYIKIYNRILVRADLSKIELVPKEKYEIMLPMHGFFIGTFMGVYLLMLIVSLHIWFTLRGKEYVFYSVYVACNCVFAMFGSFITEKYFFAKNPFIIYNLYSVLTLSHIFYILFIRYFIMPEKISGKINQYFFRPVMWIILLLNTLTCISALINTRVFKIIFDPVIITDAALGLLLVAVLYKKADKSARYVLIGSLVMIIMGVLSFIADIFELVKESYIYELGILVELFLFTHAITNRQRLLKKEEDEKKENVERVKLELESKQRELIQKAISINQNEQIFNKLKDKLNNIDPATVNNDKILKEVSSKIDQYSKQQPWEDFERYFSEVYPDFFNRVKKNYPQLKTNELHICAFIRLALSTKEIAAITGKTPKSIDVMRNRIRNKMGLNRNDKLYNTLSLP